MFSTIFKKADPADKPPGEPIYRVAKTNDIKQMHLVRTAVNENRLSDPNLISGDQYRKFITERGKGWVCEMDEDVVGFAIADLQEKNIWALFVLPKFEGKGIGRKLHNLMLDWYFSETNETVWLSTSPGTRAEQFYRKAGWTENGVYGKGEIKFDMNVATWRNKK